MSLFNKIAGNAEEQGFKNEVEDVVGGNSQYIYSIPKGEDNAIVCKFLKDPRSGGKPFIPIDYFQHKVSNDRKGIRTHPCRQSLKMGESPERDRFNILQAQLKEIRNQTYDQYSGDAAREVLDNNVEYQRLQNERKIFQIKRQGYALIVKPDDPTVYAVKLGVWAREAVFGKKGYKDVPDKDGVVQDLAKLKMTPFVDVDPETNNYGWVKLWRTGEMLDTVYHAAPLTTQITVKNEQGVPITTTQPVQRDVHQKVYNIDSLDDIPDPVEFEKANLWTEEESKLFVELKGSLGGTPSRLLKGSNEVADKNNYADNASPVENAAKETLVAPSHDEIPF